MGAEMRVTLRLSATDEGVRDAVNLVASEVRKVNDQLRQSAPAGQAAGVGMRQAAGGARELRRDAGLAGDALQRLKAAAIGYIGVNTVRRLIAEADGYANLMAKIRLAAGSQQEFTRAQRETFAIAQRTSQALTSTVTLYSRIANALRGTGIEQARILKLTETINQAFVVSGATTNEASAAVIQLSQAFASGVLRGEEFNSVNEQAPRIMQALADSLGISRGALRDLAQQGKLTSQVLLQALSGIQADKIATEFAQLPLTVERAVTQLGNAFTKYLGEADQASGATRSLAGAILVLAENIKPVMDTLVTAATIAAAWYGTRLVQSIYASTAALLAQRTAIAGVAAQWQALGITATGATSSMTRGLLSMRTLFSGLFAAFAGWQFGTYLREQFQVVRIAAAYFVESTLVGWTRLKQGALIAWEGIKFGFNVIIYAMAELLADFVGETAAIFELLPEKLGGGKVAAELRAWESSIRPAQSATEELMMSVAAINAEATRNIAVIKKNSNELINYEYRNTGAAGAAKGNAEAAKDLATNVNLAGEAAAKAAREYAKWQQSMEDLAGSVLVDSGAERMLKLGLAIEEAASRGRTDLVKQLQRALEKLGLSIEKDRLEAALAANTFKQMLDPVQELMNSYEDEARLIGMTEEARRSHQVVMEAEKEARRALDEAAQRGKIYTDEEREAIIRTAASRALWLDGLKRSAEQSKQYTDAIKRGFYQVADVIADAMTGGVKSFKDFGRSILDIARKVVAEIIANFLKLRVIEPLLQNLFSGARGGGGLFASILGGASALFGGTGAGGAGAPAAGNLIASGAQALTSGGNILGGSGALGATQRAFGLAAGTSWGSGFMAGIAESTAGFVGPPQALAATQAPGYGFGQAFGRFAPPVAGALGALYGFTQRGSSNGSFGSIAGGLAYGALGLGGAGAALGALSGTGAVAGASGAFATLGAASWVPVVGWVLAISSLVDMISGGKLFGTRYKPERITSTIGIDQAGGTATLVRTDSRQRSLFRGRQRRNVNLDPQQEQEDAAADLFRAVRRAVDTTQRALGTELTSLIEGSFKQVFDKKGNLKEEFGTILGKTYKESFDDFAKRLVAENVIATVDAALSAMDAVGATASQVAERWRGSAQQLADGAQLLLAITKDFQDASALLGDGATLEQTVALVEEYQGANESLIETYARLIQSVAGLRTAVELTGADMITAGDAFVRLAADVAEAAGGLDAANQLWDRFFKGFFSQQELLARQIDVLQAQVSAQLEGLGLDAGISLAGFRQAFTDALPTLNAEQIVQWLRAGDALLSLSEATQQLGQAAAGAAQGARAGSAFFQAMQAIIRGANDATAAARAQGASEARLAIIHLDAARKAAAAIAALRAQTQDLIAQLYGGAPGTLDAISARIAQLEGAAGDGIGAVDDALRDTFDAWMRGLEGVQQFLDGLLLNNALTTLTPQEQLGEAARQYQEALARARAGDVSALEALPNLAEQYLSLARAFFSSGDQYQAIFDAVRSELGALASVRPPGGAGGGGSTVSLVPSDELRALYEQRDALLAQQEAAHRAELALTLAQNLRDLAGALRTNVLELAAQMGLNLEEFAADLGVNLEELNAQSVEALALMAAALGTSLTEVTQGLGLQLTDIGAGVAELAAQVGINLEELTAESVRSLAELAGALGVELSELAQAVGVDLGQLADQQSLLNDALGQQIDLLPEAQRDLLRPLLEAVETAVTEADANAAIAALETAVDQLSPELRDLLAPFFDSIDPTDGTPEVEQLLEVNSWLSQLLAATLEVRDAILGTAGATAAGTPPEFAGGAANITRSGLATVHQGETIIDPETSAMLRRYGISVTGGAQNSQDVVTELRALRTAAEAASARQIAAAGDAAKRLAAMENELRMGNVIQRERLVKEAARR